MKIWLLFSLGAALAFPLRAQDAAPTPVTRFDWKLRLKQDQLWTQTLDVRGKMTPVPGRNDTHFDLHQTLQLRDEVLFANPQFLILRSTFVRFDEAMSQTIAGKTILGPDRSKYSLAFVGVPFKIKQSIDGRVLEVSGLNVLAQRGRRSLLSLAKTKSERSQLLQLLPNTDTLRARVVACQELAIPAVVLAPDESSSYSLKFYPSQLLEQPVTINRTLRAFDGQTARFDLSLPPVPDQPRKDGFFQSVPGAISGRTFVDFATGLPQINLSIRLDGKTEVVENNRRGQTPQTERTQITLKTKLLG